jgi:hypothetical protein
LRRRVLRSTRPIDDLAGPGRHWRNAQQRRRSARLSRRGRLTLAVGLGSAVLTGVVVGLWIAGTGRPDPRPSTVALEPVAAAPPPLAPASAFERLPVTRATLDLRTLPEPGRELGRVGDPGVTGRIFEEVGWQDPAIPGPLRVEYTLDAELTREVFRVLEQGRVALGHVVVMDPDTGRLLAYASTDLETFPPTETYPAASLVKVITAATALDATPEKAKLPCRFTGSPYRLTASRIDPPSHGNTVSLRKALATSNNQCFAQLAVHAVGAGPLLEAIDRFGWLSEPAPAHAAGTAESGDDRLAVGKLGCGLAGCRITPLHAVQLAASLSHGELVSPRWIDRIVDGAGRELPLPAVPAPRRVMSYELASELRDMLVDTTRRGTARSAFRNRRGRPLLGDVLVAGKTGSLSGRDPKGRYEWFMGVAPADEPRIAVATLLVQGDLWWRSSSQIAAEVLRRMFCTRKGCSAANADRWTHGVSQATASTRSGAPANVN